MRPAKIRKILVTGAAGYLGRGMALALLQSGDEVVGLDNYANSQRLSNPGFPLEDVDIADWAALSRVSRGIGQVDAVIHFAAFAQVGESCENPDRYFRNNLLCTMNLARLCVETGITGFVHSSSCTVYGIPKQVPVAESSPFAPISPYGETKRAAEEILRHTALYKPLKVINLRYFNPAGAFDDGNWGECHEPESHLLPTVVQAAISGTTVSIFGDDYDTPDGTCVRDFIHVEDLIRAHNAALLHLEKVPASHCDAINVGNGHGYSVKEIIETVQRVSGKKITARTLPRRPGDPPCLIADSRKIKETFGWEPKRSLEDMVRSDLVWRKSRLYP